MKAKLYSSFQAFLNDLNILEEHFASIGAPLPLPFGRPCGPEVNADGTSNTVYSVIQHPHEDAEKFFIYFITEGPDKDDHLVEGPLIDPDSTWPLLGE